jgi:hypothetical protein
MSIKKIFKYKMNINKHDLKIVISSFKDYHWTLMYESKFNKFVFNMFFFLYNKSFKFYKSIDFLISNLIRLKVVKAYETLSKI